MQTECLIYPEKANNLMDLFRLFYLKNIYESESFFVFRALFGDNKKENDGYREFAVF